MAPCPPLQQVAIDTDKLPALVPIAQVVQILTAFQAAHLADSDAYFACSAEQAGEAGWIDGEVPQGGGS